MSKSKDYAMTSEDLQALRDAADQVGLHDVVVGDFLKLLIPHVAHAHGLDPLEEDEKARAAQEAARERHQSHLEKAAGKAELTPAQEERKAEYKAAGRTYVPGSHDDLLDPVARDAQERGEIVAPTPQIEEALVEEAGPSVLPGSISNHPDFSTSETPEEGQHPHHSHKHGGKKGNK